ncbi:MAG TPA: carboxymuconolactone decarboxylase family protein [Candidatus Tumulicola sp.]
MAELWESLNARPELARTLARHVAAVQGGSVAPRVRELCALMVAWLNACEDCTETHAGMARQLGVDSETLDELGDFARSERFAPAERAALAAAVALTREPRGLPDAVREALARHYDAGEIVEIVATIGLYNYVTRAANAFRTAIP